MPAMSHFKLLLRLFIISISITLTLAALAAADAVTYLPLVDLGYEVHQASYNVSLGLCLYQICIPTEI
jgi:hypothetical protein